MRRLLAVLALLLLARGAAAAVTFDANATAPCVANAVVAGATGTTCATLTVGSGANRGLVCAFAFSSTAITAVLVTWDSGGTNQAMTQIVTANSTQPTMSRLYGLVAPTSGAKTLKVAWSTATSGVTTNCTSFAGVDQTGGATTFPHSTSLAATSANPSLAVTSAVGNFTISTSSQDAQAYTAVGNTQTFLDNTGALQSGAGERATGAASVTHSYTLLSAANVIVVTDILASTGGVACTPTLMLLGVGRCG